MARCATRWSAQSCLELIASARGGYPWSLDRMALCVGTALGARGLLMARRTVVGPMAPRGGSRSRARSAMEPIEVQTVAGGPALGRTVVEEPMASS